MQTLDKLLTESPVSSSDAACIHHAVACSPFVARLFTKDADLMNDLLAKLHQAFQLSDMQSFLAQQNITDEVS